MKNFELTAFLKALLSMQVLVHLHAIAKGVFQYFQTFNFTQTNYNDSIQKPLTLFSYFHNSYASAKNKPCINSEIQEPDKAISRDGSNNGIRYVNLLEDKFSYLNITALSGGDFVDNKPECSVACLGILRRVSHST